MKDYFGYSGKKCVVTGASSGMGKATCEMLVNLGAEVYALDLNPCDVNGLKLFIQSDLSEKTSIDMAFSKLPETIDCFFGIAGLSGLKTDFKTTFNVNFTANKYMASHYLPQRLQNGGSVVFVTSTAGSEWQAFKDKIEHIVNAQTWEDIESAISTIGGKDTPGPMAYFFSKLSMTYYAMKLSYEFGQKSIRVNVVLPGSTDTGMKEEFQIAAGGEEQLLAQTGTAQRLAKSEEMAQPIVFLNSDMATFISGEELYVDAGDGAMVKTDIKKSIYTSRQQ